MKRLRPVWAVKVILVILFTSIFFRCVSAVNYTVGGPTGWDLTSNLRIWSATNSFHVDDALVFRYAPIYDVIEVHQSDFAVCRISNPISTHTDGLTVVPLTQLGPRYFVCGRLNHCNLGLKLEVLVLTQLNNGTDSGNDGNINTTHTRPPRSRPPPPSPTNSPPLSQVVSNPPEDAAPPGNDDCHNSSANTDTKGNFVLEYPWWLPMIITLVIFLPMFPSHF